jgi:hypothetical protein
MDNSQGPELIIEANRLITDLAILNAYLRTDIIERLRLLESPLVPPTLKSANWIIFYNLTHADYESWPLLRLVNFAIEYPTQIPFGLYRHPFLGGIHYVEIHEISGEDELGLKRRQTQIQVYSDEILNSVPIINGYLVQQSLAFRSAEVNISTINVRLSELGLYGVRFLDEFFRKKLSNPDF